MTELVEMARHSQAPPSVVRALERRPARRWASREEAVAVIGSGWREADERVEQTADTTTLCEPGD